MQAVQDYRRKTSWVNTVLTPGSTKQFDFDDGQSPLLPLHPTRDAGLAILSKFLPKAGRLYQAHRNEDCGQDSHHNVSRLSPYLRRRLVTEQEVLSAVLARHSPAAAFKFVQEVFWRAYWKGWLEHRPLLWSAYQQDLCEVFEAVTEKKADRENYRRAVEGRTEIQPFNGWVSELQETGYLHNHARMWFASIWIFTLGLPWQLGADFFMRHLLDGDPAANTLGWRWVAGLQTQGKVYLASAANIRKNGAARLGASSDHDSGLARLATSAQPVSESLSSTALQKQTVAWPQSFARHEDPAMERALLMTDDDLALDLPFQPAGVVALPLSLRSGVAETSPLVRTFGRGAVADAVRRAEASYATSVRVPSLQANELDDVVRWVETHGFKELVHAYVPSGDNQQTLALLQTRLAARGLRLTAFVRDYDRLVWPHAQKGFFQLGKRIPDLLAALGLDRPSATEPSTGD